MHLDPPIAALVAAMAAAATERPTDLDERRAQSNATMRLARVPEPGVVVEDTRLEVDGGTIRLRVTRPEGAKGTLPGLLFVHGGGWFQGDLDTGDVECGHLASLAQCVVVSVEYRLAPEHPFPTPLEDCVAAWEWLHSTELGIDTSRVGVAGTSAGGNLAAALCLVARDRGLPMPCVQLLDAPALDLTLASPSMTEMGDSAGLTASDVKEFVDWYRGDTEATHPWVSPLLADDLTGLPPAVVLVAEHDPVRDDGERWVEALHAAGVAAAGIRLQAQLHGTWVIPLTATYVVAQDLRAAVLRRAFTGTLTR